jgi:hypothetical protein
MKEVVSITPFVLLHKLREAMAEEMKGRVVGGKGKAAEVDGGYLGGYVNSFKFERSSRSTRAFAALPWSCRLPLNQTENLFHPHFQKKQTFMLEN